MLKANPQAVASHQDSKAFRASTCGALLLVMLLIAGCSDARYRAKRAARDDHIRQIGGWAESLEDRRPEHIAWMGHSVDRLETERADTLRTTGAYVVRRLDNRDTWTAMQPHYEALLRHAWNGRPECIPNAWANLAY